MTDAAGPESVVLTGFLGTARRPCCATPHVLNTSDTAVIVNEVGEIGLDGAILRESGADAPMVMLSNGCICCQAAVTAPHRPCASGRGNGGPIRSVAPRIILETSGLSKPGLDPASAC